MKHIEQLKQAVKNGTVREYTAGHLALFKYDSSCVFANQWSKVAQKARGIILDTQTGEIVCRPFDKFFNIDEVDTTKRQVIKEKFIKFGFEATDKVDGSAICLWNYGNEWRTSTLGAFYSDQAIYALKMLYEKYPQFIELNPDYTYVFELVAAWDTKVVAYDKESLVLLAVFKNAWDEQELDSKTVDIIADTCRFERPTVIQLEPEDLIGGEKIPENAEGYVIRFGDGLRVKIKSLLYIRLHRLLSGFSPKRVIEAMQAGNYKDLLSEAPPHIIAKFDDLYAAFSQIKQNILDEVDNCWKIVQNLDTYKDKALKIQEVAPEDIRPILYARMRNKPEEQCVFKALARRADALQ